MSDAATVLHPFIWILFFGSFRVRVRANVDDGAKTMKMFDSVNTMK